MVGVPFLNLRHGPGTQHSVLEVLREGRRVTYLPETRSGWVRINAGNRQSGWVMHKFLKPLSEKPDFVINAAPSSNASGNPDAGYAVVIADALNVRNGPGRHYEVMKVIPGGTHVILDGLQKKEWWKIRFHKDGSGWVSKEFLKPYLPGTEQKPIHQLSAPGYTSMLEAGILNYMEELYREGRLQRQDRLSLVIQDLSTGQFLAAVEPDRHVKSASLIKVPILQAYMLQRYGGDIIHTVENQEHLMNMIRYSSNESSNWILGLLGGPAHAQDILDKTAVYRKLLLAEYIPEDGRTYRNKVTASDMNNVLVRLWFHRGLGKTFSRETNRQASDQMLYLLSLPGYKWVLDRIKDSTCFSSRKVVRIWDKTGFVKGVNGSAGIVEIDTPHGRRAYTIVHIMERTNFRSIPGNANRWSTKVAMVMRRISEMTYAFLSSRYESYNRCGLGLLIQYASRVAAEDTENVSL